MQTLQKDRLHAFPPPNVEMNSQVGSGLCVVALLCLGNTRLSTGTWVDVSEMFIPVDRMDDKYPQINKNNFNLFSNAAAML